MTVLTVEQERFLEHDLIQFEPGCWLWNGSLKKPSEQSNAGWARGLAGDDSGRWGGPCSLSMGTIASHQEVLDWRPAC